MFTVLGMNLHTYSIHSWLAGQQRARGSLRRQPQANKYLPVVPCIIKKVSSKRTRRRVCDMRAVTRMAGSSVYRETREYVGTRNGWGRIHEKVKVKVFPKKKVKVLKVTCYYYPLNNINTGLTCYLPVDTAEGKRVNQVLSWADSPSTRQNLVGSRAL